MPTGIDFKGRLLPNSGGAVSPLISGKQVLKDNRTELVLFITPRVVDNEIDYEGVMNDLRRKMEGLDRLFPGTPSWPASPPTPLEQVERFFAPRADPQPRPVPPGAISFP